MVKLPRFQFRLRTMLLIVAIVSVQCAVCLPALKEWQELAERKSANQRLRELIEQMDDQVFDGGTTIEARLDLAPKDRRNLMRVQPAIERDDPILFNVITGKPVEGQRLSPAQQQQLQQMGGSLTMFGLADNPRRP